MEQLTREARKLLLERADAIEARSSTPSRAALWASRKTAPVLQGFDTRPKPDALAEATTISIAFSGAEPDESPLIPIGLERRLVRRAEARWASLSRDGTLPPATAAATLLAPPFTSRAMHIRFPGRALTASPLNADPSGTPARISDVGDAIPDLCLLPDGLVAPDPRPSATLAERLVALAAQAVRDGAACHLDSDDARPEASAVEGPPQLLLRAVALPLAPDTEGVPGAIVVVSWRKLLSQSETDALHRELAAAIAWMHDQAATD